MRDPRKMIVAAGAVLFTMCALLWVVGLNPRPSTGHTSGVFVNVYQSGIWWRTWEAQMIRGGLNDGSGAFGATFKFTIEDEGLAKRAQEYLAKKSEILVTYRCEGVYAFKRSGSDGCFGLAIESK